MWTSARAHCGGAGGGRGLERRRPPPPPRLFRLDGERSSGSNTLDQWRARQSQGQNSGQAGDDNRGQDRGNDRSLDRSQGRAQNPQDPQNLGQAPALDRARDRGDDRARYDRRRGRSVEDWRGFRETGDWRRYRGYRDERRRAREEDRRRDRDDVTPARAAAVPGDLALSRGRNGAFGATIEKLVRGCAAQAAEFTNWPLDDIARTVSADETQRNALEALRGKAKAAGERLAAECPRDVPSAPAARLEAAEQGIAATLAAFDTVEPALTAFYAALNDEQKARLYRDMAAPRLRRRRATRRKRRDAVRRKRSGASAATIPRAAIAGAIMPHRARRLRARARHVRVRAKARRARVRSDCARLERHVRGACRRAAQLAGARDRARRGAHVRAARCLLRARHGFAQSRRHARRPPAPARPRSPRSAACRRCASGFPPCAPPPPRSAPRSFTSTRRSTRASSSASRG